jgi:hypothetical protein
MMNGKEEWSVKIFCDRKVLLDQIDEISKDAAILEEKIMASSPGKAYLLQRKKAELVKTEMVRICNEFSWSCFNNFKSLSNSCIMINLIPDEVQKKKNAIILNVSIFLSSDEVTKLKSIYDVICKNYGISGFSIEASGPVNLQRIQGNESVNKCN